MNGICPSCGKSYDIGNIDPSFVKCPRCKVSLVSEEELKDSQEQSVDTSSEAKGDKEQNTPALKQKVEPQEDSSWAKEVEEGTQGIGIEEEDSSWAEEVEAVESSVTPPASQEQKEIVGSPKADHESLSWAESLDLGVASQPPHKETPVQETQPPVEEVIESPPPMEAGTKESAQQPENPVPYEPPKKAAPPPSEKLPEEDNAFTQAVDTGPIPTDFTAEQPPSSKKKIIIIGVVLVGVIAIGLFFLLSSGSKKQASSKKVTVHKAKEKDLKEKKVVDQKEKKKTESSKEVKAKEEKVENIKTAKQNTETKPINKKTKTSAEHKKETKIKRKKAKRPKRVAKKRANKKNNVDNEVLKRAEDLVKEGNSRLMNGDYENAIKMYKAAIKIAPTYPAPYRNLGVAYARMNNPRMAVKYYKKFLKLAPYSKEAPQIRKIIQDYYGQ